MLFVYFEKAGLVAVGKLLGLATHEGDTKSNFSKTQ